MKECLGLANLYQFDYINCLITLSVIALSGFRFSCAEFKSTAIKVQQI